MFDNRGMQPIYFDTEFTGLHQNTTLISIGCISASGNYFYAECTDYDRKQVDDWISDNVIRNLLWSDGHTDGGHKASHVITSIRSTMEREHNYRFNVKIVGTSKEISEALRMWLQNESVIAGKKIQMYSDCLAYDWMLFNDLVCPGDATTIPNYIYYIPMDLCTALQYAGIDPDATRENVARLIDTDKLSPSLRQIFSMINSDHGAKHNSLWDAVIIKECFDNLPDAFKFSR